MARLSKPLLFLLSLSCLGGTWMASPGKGSHASAGGSAPTFDSAASSSALTTVNLSFSHTCTGSNRLLIVWVGQGNPPSPSVVNGVTYNGVLMNAIPSSSGTDSAFCHVTGFYLINPATGANNVVVTLNSSVTQVAAASISFAGANQTTPLGTAVATGATTSGPATVTVSSATNEIVTCGTFTDSTTIAVGTGTSRAKTENIGVTPDSAMGVSTATGASSVTPTWSLTGTVDPGWAISAVSVKP